MTRRHGGKKRVALRAALVSLGVIALFPGTAYAYLDPGTGSMLLSAVIGIAATLFFMVKTFYYKAAGIFYRLLGAAPPSGGENGIVFYSEGKQYWNTFKPVLEALDKAGEEAVYLTSGADDPGLAHPFTHVRARHVGSGNRAYAAMNLLEAAVCVTTTPGLDVLQIRRSPGVAHYAYLAHAPTDAAIFKLYSFDYFDTVLCSGPHQIKSIRYLEELRGTKPKNLPHTGCPYMDMLADELQALGEQRSKAREPGPVRVLVAPTWGNNGLLSRFGLKILLPMAKAGFALTIRPHPQSRAVEKDLLATIEAGLAAFPNVSWDSETSQLPAMLGSDVLVSDLSGIVFDYAFVMEKPVVTIAMAVDTRGLEAGDLPWPAWELTQLPQLGATIDPDRVHDLPNVIAALPAPEVFAERVRALRAESLYNFRSSGDVAARQILEIRRTIAAGEKRQGLFTL
ncbi:CDP-glycerol glycerophosphotransferase family protein [Desulfovibrio sp. OttesenSCG-928-O18]|nr:CDP-glycerol glycerophosphotransferase family protein [Desulfovibrio sp. OttesenSCG-928-O18]